MKFIIALFISYASSTAANHVAPRPPTTPPPTVSQKPSALPSESPSSMPSDWPSESPSSMPSETPSSMPSSMPSETPSCTPSHAPTPSPSVNLFYPDQTSNGFETGCLNDGAEPAWMQANPSTWLFTTLDKCCKQHFSWNYDFCMGHLDDTCNRALWYPDWDGNNEGCVRDGNEPFYMLQNPTNFIFSTKKDCCDEHYSWALSTCMGGANAKGSGKKWYADWTSGDETCKNDGKAPDYMVDNDSLWLYADQDDCCKRFFNYKFSDCLGSSATSAGTGKYFPDWAGDNEGCIADVAAHRAPDYMKDSTTWLFATLDACCEAHYGWMESECKGTSGSSTATGSGKWYINWSDYTCVQDCKVAAGTDCGGFADHYGQSNLHPTKAKCCSTHMAYDYHHCFD